jgi:threonine efflux protein
VAVACRHAKRAAEGGIMNAAADLLAFAGVMALAQFSPGPDMILLTRTSLLSGARAGVQMALGIACGLAVHATVAIGGLALVVDRLPSLRRGLGLLAAGYLTWLAGRILVEIWRSLPAGKSPETAGEIRTRRPFLRGLWCNLLNPKAAIVLTALSAPFLRGEHPAGWPLALWLVIVCQGCVLWSLWARVLQWSPLRLGYQRIARWIDTLFALLLVVLAVRLLVS